MLLLGDVCRHSEGVLRGGATMGCCQGMPPQDAARGATMEIWNASKGRRQGVFPRDAIRGCCHELLPRGTARAVAMSCTHGVLHPLHCPIPDKHSVLELGFPEPV